MWHRLPVRGPLLRFEGATVLDRHGLALAIRGALLLMCSGLSVADAVGSGSTPSETLGRLGLLVTIAISSSTAMALWPRFLWIPVLESAAVALLAMTNDGPHEALLPYLLAPALDAGLVGGVEWAVYAVGASSAMVLAAGFTEVTEQTLAAYSSTAAEWVVLSLLVGLLGAWARRLGIRTAGRDEAYSSAFRLVNQLRTVARHLSGGLDARQLAQMLLQDLQSKTSFDRGAIFIGGAAGVLAPLASVGHAPDWKTNLAGDYLIADVWQHQRPATAPVALNGLAGMVSVALPLMVGSRTVGVAAVERRRSWERELDLDGLQGLVDEAALRIETALLFADVRAIATADERKRLAREIHDGIAQDLAFLGYAIDDLTARAHDDLRGDLHDLRGQITRVVGDLRMSIYELRSEVQTEAGLGSLISDFVGSVGTSSRMTVHLALDESPDRLPVATEAEVLRIAQEAVNNARKHAEAENLWVSLSVRPPQVRLTVEDDGRGMQAGRRDSYGLHIMRERAEGMGGRLTVSERNGGGTKVELQVGQPTRRTGNRGAAEMSDRA